MKIKICKRFPKVNKFHKKLTKAFPNDTITVKSCISICKICKNQPVTRADGVKIKGKNMGKIINKIEKL